MVTEVDEHNPPSEIKKFFSGKTLFLTGASGFLGRLLVEKLLRSCKGISHIYILLREKKGKTPEERFKEVFEIPAFDVLRMEQPDFLSKISILEGDLALPYLGLSEASLDIIKDQVNCVYSVGATVRFDESLRKATFINVRSTRDLLRIAKEMKQLKSFVHISTAFSNCIRKDIDEIFYEPMITGNKLLDLVECLEDKVLEDITSVIIQENPNTYVFTKAIAEEVIKTESKNLPVAIVRPSIVISTYKEPVPGWIDNLYGPTAILQGAALGLLRTLYGNKKNVAELVPADFVINTTIAASWDVAQNKNLLNHTEISEPDKPKLKIYNYVSSPQNPITWDEYQSLATEEGMKIPSPLIIWYPSLSLNSNYYKHLLVAFLSQTIPAYVVDFFAICLGKKPMFVNAFKKIDKFCDVISYFTMRQWNFKNANVQELWKSLNGTDKKLFNFDITSMPWRSFFVTYLVGARIYLLKDPIETIPQGRRKILAVKIGHYILVTLLCLLFYKFIMLIWYLF